ncbi:hypothetical protein FBQ82_04795 [Anaerolineae bacterium CFX7]|nr:hypothetical protein [Anaerolineae bacterium CFX7]
MNTMQDERFRFAAIAFVLVSVIAQIAFGIVTFSDTALFILMVTMASIAAAADYHMFERYSQRGGNSAQMFFVLFAFGVTFLALVVDVIRVTDKGVVFKDAAWWLPFISFVNAVVSVGCYLAFGLFSDAYKSSRSNAAKQTQLIDHKINAAFDSPQFQALYAHIARARLTQNAAQLLNIPLPEARALLDDFEQTPPRRMIDQPPPVVRLPPPPPTPHALHADADAADFLADAPNGMALKTNGNGNGNGNGSKRK